jgi:hypothetical protein
LRLKKYTTKKKCEFSAYDENIVFKKAVTNLFYIPRNNLFLTAIV